MRTLICGLMALTAGVAVAATYTATGKDGGGSTTLTDGQYWSGGIAPSNDKAAGHDFVCTQDGFRGPGDTTFTCNSLTLGGRDNLVRLYFKEGSWSFPAESDGLVFVRVDMQDWTTGMKTYYFNGPVTFSDEFSKTDAGRYACSFNTSKPDANAVVHDFTGKVTAQAQAVIENHLNNPTGGRHYGIRFSGDLTAFEGEMVMGNSSRLEIGATTMPGTITVSGADVIVAPVAGTAGFSVGTLTMADGTTIEASLNRDTGACQPITVTQKLTAGTLTVRILAETYTSGTSAPERKYAILRFPSTGSTFDPAKVTLTAASDAVKLNDLAPSVETEGDVTTFYLTHAATLPIINRVAGKEYLDEAETWSDGLLPHGNAEYVSSSDNNGNFRLRTPTSPYVFPGNLLTITGVKSANIIAQFNDITISNMVIKTAVNMLNWHEAGKNNPASFSPGGIRYYRGNIVLEGGDLAVQSQLPVHFVLDGNVSGTKRLNVAQNQGSGTMTSPFYVELCGENTFTDIMNVWSKNATSFDNGVVICFREGRNLGGNPASFIYNANLMGAYVTYRALASTVLKTMNRGISVDNSAFEALDGVTLTIRQKIRYVGDLTKRGAGTLVLDGDHDITASAPTLHVKDGFLKVAKSTACSGVALAFTGDAGLKVAMEDPASPGQGIAGTSLAIDTDDGFLHVTIDADPMPTHGLAPICTVPTAAADALRGKFIVGKPAAGFKGVVTERTLEAGTVTFSAEILTDGMMLILR